MRCRDTLCEEFVSCGVVQGSCLGPLLFLLYINDIVELFSDSVTPKLYADDIKLYTTVKSNVDCIRFRITRTNYMIGQNYSNHCKFRSTSAILLILENVQLIVVLLITNLVMLFSSQLTMYLI